MNIKYADNFRLLLNDKLCDIADAVLRYYDPCQKKENSCLITDDISDGSVHCCFHGPGSGCWLWRDGCQGRLISCKVWLCHPCFLKAPKDCVDTLQDIERIAIRYGLVRRPTLGDRYVGRDAQIRAAAEMEAKAKENK